MIIEKQAPLTLQIATKGACFIFEKSGGVFGLFRRYHVVVNRLTAIYDAHFGRGVFF